MTQQDPVVCAFVPDSWQLTLQQPLQGYRFSVDAFLLADFVPLDAISPLADFGTGCGVVALCLARRLLQGRIVGVELQASLATVARQNVRHNRLEQRVDVVRADLRQAQTLFATGTFGTVVCNPPYRPVGHGRLNPNPEKAVARHELTLTLVQLLQAAQHVLRRRGVLVMIYHPARLAELCTRLQAMRLCPRRLRWVHPTLQEPAVLVLVEAVLDGREPLTVLPPLPICDASGAYSAEMQTIFRRRQAAGEIRYGSAR